MTAPKSHHRYSRRSTQLKFQSAQPWINHYHDTPPPSEICRTSFSDGQFPSYPDNGTFCDTARMMVLEEPPIHGNLFQEMGPDRTLVRCSVEIMTSSLRSCTCQPISLVCDPGHGRAVSEALRQYRRNHLLERTGAWLFGLDTFNEWLEMSRSSILWLVGSPGMGKSMLSSAVLEMLNAKGGSESIVTFWFCDGHFKACEWILGILSNLVAQLLSRSIEQSSLDRLTDLATDLANIEDRLSASELQYFLTIIQHSLRPHETLFLILDGFDDSSDSGSGHGLLYTFLEVFNSPMTRHRIKIFISSRPYYSPCLNLGSLLRVDMDLEPLARVDLDAYVRTGVRGLQLSDPFQNIDRLVDLLSSDPNATFLTAGLTLRYLSKDCSPVSVSTNALEAFATSGLSYIYNWMLNGILDKDLARTLLMWAVYSARPLLWEEVEYILQLVESSAQTIHGISGGLLTIGKGQTVNFIHLSARDHLLSLSEGDVHWLGKPSSAHENIVRTCLKALSPMELLQCFDVLTQVGTYSGNERRRTQFSYARHYLVFHYTHGEPRSHSLPGLLHSFLRKSLESEDFKQYAKSTASLQEILDGTVRTCGATYSHCMRSRLILGTAADLGLEKLARLELQMGGNAHLACKFNSRATIHPLHLAAQAGHANVVQLLLRYGADLTTLSPSGRTPLFYAIAKGCPDIMRLLLNHAVKTNGQSLPLSRDTHRTTRHPRQQLYLVARFSDICNCCTDKQPHYVISKPSQGCQDSNLWPSILIKGEPLSEEELSLSCSSWPISSKTSTLDAEEREEKAIIKWFAGADMYDALEIAARHGIGIVRDILLAADNDRGLIDSFTSVTELVSKLKIS